MPVGPCVSFVAVSPNAHTVKTFHTKSTELQILIMRDYSVAVIILALQAGDRGSTPRSRIFTFLKLKAAKWALDPLSAMDVDDEHPMPPVPGSSPCLLLSSPRESTHAFRAPR